jgi:hypothetical protein
MQSKLMTSREKCGTIQIFGNDYNISNPDSGRNYGKGKVVPVLN